MSHLLFVSSDAENRVCHYTKYSKMDHLFQDKAQKNENEFYAVDEAAIWSLYPSWWSSARGQFLWSEFEVENEDHKIWPRAFLGPMLNFMYRVEGRERRPWHEFKLENDDHKIWLRAFVGWR